eukprot:TRINITY_DN2177_c1_g4_i1.p1 TRINITY_DN2177_c1_g4~~TRINITY_DN2177_c1_g4_i1.p1  ORF type:complete len:583 (+),score=249.56 TRINITY_DN2177_c1_g4_i1:113-1861(+)
MGFVVLVAADLGGKCNFELSFPQKPSLPQLRARVDAALGSEAAIRTPHPFQVSRIQVFDERLQMWVDLVAAVQLEDYCQLYAFQVETSWNRDLPGHIPPPQRPCEPAVPLPPPPGTARSVSPRRDRSVPAASPPPRPASSFEQSPFQDRHQSPFRARAAPPADLAPTHHDKVRCAFEELDKARTRRVSMDDWIASFERLRLCAVESLSQETSQDLFKKADRDRDGFVTLHEFQMFAEQYPKLLDSLYYRARSLVHENARKGNLDRARDEQSVLARRLDDAVEAANQAEAASLEQQEKADAAARAIAEAQDREQDGRRAREEAHQESEAARQKLKEQVSRRDSAREAVRQKDAHVRQAQRGLDASEKKQKKRKDDVDRAEKELDRLRKLLEHKQEELGKLTALLDESAQEVAAGQQAVSEEERGKQEADAAAQDEQAHVAELEGALKRMLDSEGDAAQEHRALQRAVAQAQQLSERESQELAQQKRAVDSKKQAEERAERALDDCRKLVEELETRDRELDDKRREEEAKENAIVEGEIRLREQRAAVEQKEHALCQAHSDFAVEMGRVQSPPRGLRGSPPMTA